MLLLLSHHYHPLSVSMWCIGWLLVLLLLSHTSSVSVCRDRCGLYCLGVGGAAVVVTSFISLFVVVHGHYAWLLVVLLLFSKERLCAFQWFGGWYYSRENFEYI